MSIEKDVWNAAIALITSIPGLSHVAQNLSCSHFLLVLRIAGRFALYSTVLVGLSLQYPPHAQQADH